MATHHSYLGLQLSSNLSWDHHITTISKKANQILAFLRRNLGSCPVKIKEQAYFTLVRPHLEYVLVLGTLTLQSTFWKLRKFNAGRLAGLNPVTSETLGQSLAF